jgi:hypothetical protein
LSAAGSLRLMPLLALMSSNNRMQRAGMHKVLGRGRDAAARKIFMLARVPTSRRAGADAGRSAALT